MYSILFLSLALLPLISADRYATPIDNEQALFVPRSAALYYLVGQPIVRYGNPALDRSSDSSSATEYFTGKQRAKRIYWENLAFHAANFNQKVKKL